MVGSGETGQAVVIPAVRAPSATTAIRSLGSRDIHTIAASATATAPAFHSRYTDETVSVTSPTEDILSYRDDLLELAARPSVRTILPFREADVYVLSKYRSMFGAEVETVWPALESLVAVHDRERLLSRAAAVDVPTPETALLSDIDDWDREQIVKGRFAMLASEYLQHMHERDLDTPAKTIYLDPGERPDAETIREQMGHDPIVQEYVEGTEYTVRALFDRGTPLVTTQKRMVRGYKYPRGPSVAHETVDIPELEDLTTRLLADLDWHGVASVGYLRDAETGEFNLLEVNPRYPASLPMDVHAGTDYPYYHWQLATGADEIEPEHEVGIMSHLLRGELVHLHSVLFEEYPLVEAPSVRRTLREMVSSLYRHPNFDYLSLDDPAPFVRDTIEAIRSTFEDDSEDSTETALDRRGESADSVPETDDYRMNGLQTRRGEKND